MVKKNILVLALTLLCGSTFCSGVEDAAPKKVLVVSPHPDDDVLGCGGCVIHHVQRGDEVTTVYLTSGERGGIKSPEEAEARGLQREQEGRAGSNIMGVQKTVFLRQRDGRLQDDKRTAWFLEKLINEERPDVIYTTHDQDTHNDHEAAARLVVAVVKNVYHFDNSYHPVVRFSEIWAPLRRANYFEDVTDVMEQKLRALSCHRSQLNDIRYDKAIMGLNHYRAHMQGHFMGIEEGYSEEAKLYAEAFDEWQV